MTLGLAALLVYWIDLGHVVALITRANPALVIAALAVAVADRLLMIGKWYPLLRAQLATVTIGAAARAYLASGVAHYVLPASVGADVLRAVALGRGRSAVVEVGASIMAERVLGLIGSAAVCLVAVAVAIGSGIPLTVIVPWACAAIALGMAALVLPLNRDVVRYLERWLAARQSRWTRYGQRFTIAYAVYGRRPGLLTSVGVLSAIEQLFPVLMMWLAAMALGVSIGPGAFVVAVTLTLFAVRLPISIGGLGVGEGALVYLLGLYGVAAPEALAVALLGRVLEVLVNAGPGVFLWRDLVAARQENSVAAA